MGKIRKFVVLRWYKRIGCPSRRYVAAYESAVSELAAASAGPCGQIETESLPHAHLPYPQPLSDLTSRSPHLHTINYFGYRR